MHVLIVGSGISGLRLADLLSNSDITFNMIEARDRIGGRILTEIPSSDNYYDLGPTWFWPEKEPKIVKLIEELKLSTIEQYNNGQSLLELNDNKPVKFIKSSELNSYCMRIEGGINALVQAIYRRIPSLDIELNTRANAIKHNKNQTYTITAVNKLSGEVKKYDADAVVFTLPPRLLFENIDFTPELPEEVKVDLLNKPTWMGAQAKAIITYEQAFWRIDGLSGNAISWQGPLREIYDVSTPNGDSALFGFFGMTPADRSRETEASIEDKVISQLVRLFGEQARDYKAFYYKDWSQDKNTVTSGDTLNIESFPTYGQPPAYLDNVYFAGTEYDTNNGGHLEGALASAEYAFNNLTK
ncbi:FAD-dependent oxidoreductase [Staphylococcus sp. ACRSN]|uniref:flavin monoamine oxidase family protein n=1 Tax=Staphylococcus sp. ACRSN TaxID=2918214 RepID=UPI001EF2417E|nr:FAD-dependent oxidoreductase [Staphylococcus sp. ACRSN]MCG7338948.1 FAD-dependent oxidoreductase [Staphylococcus sp. ACRSN]